MASTPVIASCTPAGGGRPALDENVIARSVATLGTNRRTHRSRMPYSKNQRQNLAAIPQQA
jgi:hypothetical protein